MTGVWTVQAANHSKDTEQILKFLLDEYSRIFGKNIMMNSPCIVYNDPYAQCPMFIHSYPLRIRLSQQDLDLWFQTVFQLAHELCHYAIYQIKPHKHSTLTWFEETLCDAMSLYGLYYAANNWHKSPLAKKDSAYPNNFKRVLDYELGLPTSNRLSRCTTVNYLRMYEMQKLAEIQRESYRMERNFIYREMLGNPTEIRHIVNYQYYLDPNGVTLNFDRWLNDSPCRFIEALKIIQPVKTRTLW